MAVITESLVGLWSAFLGHLPFLSAGLIILLLTWGLSNVGLHVLTRFLKRTRLRASLRELAERFAAIGIWVLGIFLAAMVVFPGLTPAKALGTMGIASIAVGFAFKDIFENFFAGVLILWRFPLEKGDFIECQGISGRVEKISVRTTEIRRVSDELVVIPNATLFKNPVEVLTNRDHRRLTLIVGVAYGEDVAEAVEVIREAVQTCRSVDADREVQIFPHAFGASSIDIEIAWWSGATPFERRHSRGEVVAAVKAALDEADIEIPFPHRTHTFKEPLRTIVSEP